MSEETPNRRELARRRRANVPGGRNSSHKVSVSPEEEAQLQLRAAEQGVSVVRLLVESALASTPRETVSERRLVVAELFKMQRLLAGAATNINQLAHIANGSGSVPKEAGPSVAALRHSSERIDALVEHLIGR